MANQKKWVASLILLCFLLTGVSSEVAHETWHFLYGTPNELHGLSDHVDHIPSASNGTLTSFYSESECVFIKVTSALGQYRALRPLESGSNHLFASSCLSYLQGHLQWPAKENFVHYYSCGPPASFLS